MLASEPVGSEAAVRAVVEGRRRPPSTRWATVMRIVAGDPLEGDRAEREGASLGLTFGDEPTVLKSLEFALCLIAEINTVMVLTDGKDDGASGIARELLLAEFGQVAGPCADS